MKNKIEKILNGCDRICLFCGQPEKEKWDDCNQYFECDCKDAIEERKILSQIEELKRKLPKPKYSIIAKPVLYKI